MNLRRFSTPALVTVLAVLVWALAESQTLQRRATQVDVTLGTSGSGRILRISEGERWSGRVEVELEGPAAALDRVVQGASGEAVALRVGIELSDATGDLQVDLREALSRSSLVRNMGVRVRRVDPASVLIRVEPLVQRTLPVTVSLDAGEPEVPPVPTPAEVTVFAPESVMAKLPDSVVARVPAAAASTLRPGDSVEVPGVPIILDGFGAGIWGVRSEPSQVSALVTLRRRTAETTLPEIAVEVALPPSEVGLWKVEMGPESRVLRGVRVGGTATAVGRLGAGQVAVRAIVQLTSADLASRVSRKPVVLMGLPPGVGPLDEAMAVDLVITPVVGP